LSYPLIDNQRNKSNTQEDEQTFFSKYPGHQYDRNSENVAIVNDWKAQHIENQGKHYRSYNNKKAYSKR